MNGERRFRIAVLGACLVHATLLLLHTPERAALPVAVSRPVDDRLVGVELVFTQQSWVPASSPDQQTQEPLSREPKAAVSSGVRPPAVGSKANALETSAGVSNSSSPARRTDEGKVAAAESATDSTSGRGGRASRALPRVKGQSDDFSLAYALSQQEQPPDQVAIATDRLRQSMQQDQADNDRKLGLNVPAPLILAMESAAREVAIPSNSVATFTANFDGSGNMFGLECTGSDHSSPQWQKLTQRVQQALSGRKLSIARNTKGVDLKLRLIAHVQLPSGADPGLGVDVLGLPVKKGQGKRSGKITILDPTPKILEFEIPGTNADETVRIPVPGIAITLLSVAADPADIGAPARQMIRVHVIDEKIH